MLAIALDSIFKHCGQILGGVAQNNHISARVDAFFSSRQNQQIDLLFEH